MRCTATALVSLLLWVGLLPAQVVDYGIRVGVIHGRLLAPDAGPAPTAATGFVGDAYIIGYGWQQRLGISVGIGIGTLREQYVTSHTGASDLFSWQLQYRMGLSQGFLRIPFSASYHLALGLRHELRLSVGVVANIPLFKQSSLVEMIYSEQGQNYSISETTHTKLEGPRIAAHLGFPIAPAYCVRLQGGIKAIGIQPGLVLFSNYKAGAEAAFLLKNARQPLFTVTLFLETSEIGRD